MDSDSNTTDNTSSLEELLADIQTDAENVNVTDDFEAIKGRVDNLELLVEEFSKARELQGELQSYVRDLKEEISDIRNYRFWVTAFSVVMSLALFALLISCMTAKPDWFIELDGTLQVSLIISLGTGSVFLMSLNLRGVYRSRHERHQGELLPEAIRAALEAFRSN